MFPFLFIEFTALSNRSDAIISKYYKENIINVASSGSIGQYYEDKCHQTYPNQTIFEGDDPKDWCSNIAKDKNNPPWIEYSLNGKTMEVSGYSFRTGCCYFGCCCMSNGDYVTGCCCDPYVFSLQGSNDNKTWKVIHKVEKEKYTRHCDVKEYSFKQTERFRFIRFVQDEPYPGCEHCMAINKFEIYGNVFSSGYFNEDIGADETDESVSIIGRVEKSEN